MRLLNQVISENSYLRERLTIGTKLVQADACGERPRIVVDGFIAG